MSVLLQLLLLIVNLKTLTVKQINRLASCGMFSNCQSSQDISIKLNISCDG